MQLQDPSVLNMAFNSGVLAIGSTKSEISIGTAVNYTFRGRFFQRGTSASIAVPVDASGAAYKVIPAGQKCSILVLVDPANSSAVSGVQGPLVNVGEVAPLPHRPDGRVIIGALTISNVTNAFTLGTTFFDASGVTTTYYNLATHPGTSLT